MQIDRDITHQKEASRSLARLAARERSLSQELRLLLDSTVEGIYGQDRDGRCTFVNVAAATDLGYEVEEMVGRPMHELIHHSRPDGSPFPPEECDLMDTERDGPSRGTQVFWRRDGSSFPAQCSVATLVEDGVVVGSVVTFVDITEQLQAQEAIQEAEERFRLAFENAVSGIGLLGLDGRWLKVNRAMTEMVGYTEEQLLAMTFRDFTHPEDSAADAEAFERLLREDADSQRIEKRLIQGDGNVLWMTISRSVVRDSKGRPLYVVAQAEDVTKEREAADALKQLADHDHLTGLLNRRRFDEELERAVLDTARHGTPWVLLLLDLDGFKAVNDTLGHAAGDGVIVGTAAVFRHRLRATDVVARIGGGEFAALLSHVALPEAAAVAEELVRLIEALPVRGGLRVGASVGVIDVRGSDPQRLLREADSAMYLAKNSGQRVSVVG